MKPRTIIAKLLLLSALCTPLHAAISLPTETPTALNSSNDGPAKEALELFQSGRHAKAITLATPLAEKGNGDALYLLGFAYETGKGVEANKAKALEYYRKASAAKHKDAVYRLAFILLSSEKEEERQQARQQLEEAAKTDAAVAGRILGEAYLRGLLSPTADPDKAVFWWTRSADAGDIASIMLIARFHEGQFGFPELKSNEKALNAYAKAAGLGNAAAMAALGSRYLSGDEAIRNEAKGREWLKKAIAAKEFTAYLVLGDYEENVKKDLKAALTEYERGKDANQMDCILRSADFYLQGKGVEKDTERGMSLLTKAADSGSPVANFRLAVSILNAEKPDLTKGYAHLLAAANGNLVEAQNELGLLYLSGKLGLADGNAAIAWLTRAAKNGYAQAQFNLGALYERGAGGAEQNIQNAGQLYSLAANQGHSLATLSLARLVYEGIGTAPNPAKAWALATIAAELGEKEGQPLADQIAKNFDAKQQAEAKSELEAMKSDNKSGQKSVTKPTKPGTQTTPTTAPAGAPPKPVKPTGTATTEAIPVPPAAGTKPAPATTKPRPTKPEPKPLNLE